MEYTKQLTIESVEAMKSGPNRKGGSWTLYKVQASGERYSAFDLNLTPGMTANFRVKEEPSDKLNPKTNQPYVNKTIVSFVGRAEDIKGPTPVYPASPSADAQAIRQRIVTESMPATQADILALEEKIAALAKIKENILTRVENLERAGNPLN